MITFLLIELGMFREHFVQGELLIYKLSSCEYRSWRKRIIA
jgi:hypothetical protein